MIITDYYHFEKKPGQKKSGKFITDYYRFEKKPSQKGGAK